MYNQNILEHEEPIHLGHLGAIALCAVLLIGITFMRNGFSFHVQNNSNSVPQVLTYEQAYAQVAAKEGVTTDTALADSGTSQQQLAIVDPSLGGQVAGATTDVDAPPIEQMITAKEIADLKINLQTQATTAGAVQAYAAAMAGLQANQNTLGLLAALNTDDKQTLTEASQNANRIFVAMQKVSVPRGLEYYHKYNMFFYQTLGSMADIFSGKRPESDMQVVSEQLFALIQQIDSMKQDIASKWGVQL